MDSGWRDSHLTKNGYTLIYYFFKKYLRNE